MGAEDIMGQVWDFLGQYISNTEIDPDDNLFTSGVVNSLFAMQLVLFVEKEFGIQVANEDLDIENFKSLNAIVGFIENKLGTAS
ncbi:MAG: acyl carrier protein [Verrucomicrobia bacterium]|nr:acyl carrier protein [Verrucomicrobiota bacterium]